MEMEMMNNDVRRMDLNGHDAFFCNMINVIPEILYFPQDGEENWMKSNPNANKYLKNPSAKACKQVVKEQSKKAKKAKFGSEAQMSNIEKQKQIEVEEAMEVEDAEMENDIEKPEMKKDMTDLRQRLQERIEVMRTKRKAEKEGGNVSKRVKKVKAKKGDKAKNVKDSKTNKEMKAVKEAKSTKNVKTVKKVEEVKKVAEIVTTEPVVEKKKSVNKKKSDVDASTPQLSFGSLVIGEENLTSSKPSGGKKSKVTGVKNLLKQAEANQKRMEDLKETEEGKKFVLAKGMHSAMLQAAGEKLKDDPKLLRKAVKRKEKAKEKSSKEWKQRVSNQVKGTKARQKVKSTNRRLGRKGQPARAGFEGKKGDKSFLNKSSTKDAPKNASKTDK